MTINILFSLKKINPKYNRDALEYKLLLNELIQGSENQKHLMIHNLLQSYSDGIYSKPNN